MGTILSTVEGLEKINWTQPKKGRVYKAKQILFIGDVTAIIELENGSYTVAGRRHVVNGNYAIAGYGLDDFTQTVLYGLVKLGILTRDQVKKHISTADARRKERERKHNIRRLREICEELEIAAPLVE